jgi:competence protein ComEC
MAIFRCLSFISEKIKGLSLPPLVPWCCFFCFGIVLESYGHIPFIPLYILLCLILVLSCFYLKNIKAAYPLLFGISFLLGALAFSQTKVLPKDSLSRIVPATRHLVTLKGIVVSDPALSQDSYSFIFSISQLRHEGANVPMSGKVFVRRRGNEHLSYGDELLIEGGLYRPYNFSSGKEGHYADYLKSRGIYAILNSKDENTFKKIGQNKSNFIVSFALFLRHKAEGIIASRFEPSSASLLEAMLLGEAGKIPASVKNMMIRTGTWHIMVVSGSHTTLVAFILLLFLKFFKVPRRNRYGLTIVLLVIYCFVTGASSPVVRATVMSIVLLISYLIERNPLFYNSLALAALVILFFDPTALFNAGFQLSFLSVFFIVWLYPKINTFILDKTGGRQNGSAPENFWRRHLICPLASCFSVSLAAWIGTAPVIVFTFGNFSPVTVFANMAVVPLAMLAVTAGFVLLIAAILLPPLALFLAVACDFLIFLFLNVNLFFANLPLAFLTISSIPLWAVFLYYILVFLFFNRSAEITSF